MYIYGYCYSSLINRHKYKKIFKFCNLNDLNISEVFSDYGTPRYDYIALKRLLSKKDILIIAEVDDLGKNKNQILEELTYLIKNGIRIMVLDHPETLFDFPANNADEIEQYYANVDSSNNNLLRNYAASTKQSIKFDTLEDKTCRIIINGKEIEKLRPSIFLPPGNKSEVLIESARILAKLNN